MDALASMSIPTLLEEAAKRTKDGSKDAMDELTAAISTPAHQLNYLLSGEMFFQERVIKKAINRIGEELPGDFQVEGAFVDFHKSALASLKESPRLKPFQSWELSRPREVNWKQAVAEVEMMLGEHDTKIVEVRNKTGKSVRPDRYRKWRMVSMSLAASVRHFENSPATQHYFLKWRKFALLFSGSVRHLGQRST